MPIRDTPGPRCVPVTSRHGPERRKRRKGRPPACGVCPFSSPSCVFSFSFSSSPFWLSCRSPSCGVGVKSAMSLQSLSLPKNPSPTLPPGTPPRGYPVKGDACREKKGFWGQSRGFWGGFPELWGFSGGTGMSPALTASPPPSPPCPASSWSRTPRDCRGPSGAGGWGEKKVERVHRLAQSSELPKTGAFSLKRGNLTSGSS